MSGGHFLFVSTDKSKVGNSKYREPCSLLAVETFANNYLSGMLVATIKHATHWSHHD